MERFSILKLITGIIFYSSFSYGNTIGYKGDILYFTGDPSQDKSSTHYYEGGLLLVKDGHIVEAGAYHQMVKKHSPTQVIDYSNKIIIPGFIDTHVHYPQMEIIASYGEQLIDWLNEYTYPAEIKFSNYQYASGVADFFLDSLIRNGTTTAMVFATSNPVSVDAFFEQALKKNMRMISGKVLMDRNAPAELLDTPETGYTESERLIKKWQHRGRLGYAVTPRFAPTSSPEQLSAAGKLLRKYPDVWLQTHLAENKEEVAWVKKLFPHQRSYLDVYQHYGLVGKKSIFAHSIYIDKTDFSLLSDKKAAVAFCPTSNFFLGSGFFNLKQAKAHQVKLGLGTDVGAGTSLSLLKTMGEAYKDAQLQKSLAVDPDSVDSLSPLQNLYLATLGGARALSLESQIGSFLPGREADFIVLNPRAGKLSRMKVAEKTASSLDEKVFTMEIVGDEKYVEHTYIMGVKKK